MKDLILGIDTSNYRTSVALVDLKGEIILNHRELLKVPEGKRGLRQSEAFFQHVNALPDAVESAMEYRDRIAGISVSTRPRPREGSYMPCFGAGYAAAKELASALNVPLLETSHQEGHVEAIKFFSEFKDEKDIIFYHLSGGTTEALYGDEIVGGTKDISYGQVLDRIGVMLGFSFPSGEFLDQIALNTEHASDALTPIKVKDGWLNLSGIETQAMRSLESICDVEARNSLIKEVMDKILDSMVTMSEQLSKKFNTRNLIFSGGVSSSGYIRSQIPKRLKGYNIVFGSPELSGDNAVGTALIMVRGQKEYL